MRKLAVLLTPLLLLSISLAADSFTLTLVSPDLSVAPGGTLTFELSTVNDAAVDAPDPYLSFIGFSQNIGAGIDPTEGDGMDVFDYPTVAPGSEVDDLFSITWLGGATPGYGVSGSFDLSTQYCTDDTGSDCLDDNPDVILDFSASVQESATPATPEPGTLLLLTTGLVAMLRRRARSRLGD